MSEDFGAAADGAFERGNYIERSRCLRQDFCDHLHREDAWPTRVLVESWFRAQRLKWSPSVFASLRAAGELAEKYPVAFLRMLLEADSGHRTFGRARECLFDYLRHHGVANPTALPLADVVAVTCEPPTVMPRPGSKRAKVMDYLVSGVVNIAMFCGSTPIRRHVRSCGTGADVDHCVTMMFERFGCVLHPTRSDLTKSEAIAAAETGIGIPLHDYQRRAREWHRFSAWTVMRAFQRDRNVGSTIVLPVREEAYQRMRAGYLATSDCTPEDLALPSRFLVVEGCAEDQSGLRSGESPTRAMLACLVVQFARMLQTQLLPIGSAVHWLSFAATPANRERLVGSGFRPLGRKMHRTGADLFERVLRIGDDELRALAENCVLAYGGRVWSELPPK